MSERTLRDFCIDVVKDGYLLADELRTELGDAGETVPMDGPGNIALPAHPETMQRFSNARHRRRKDRASNYGFVHRRHDAKP